MDGIHPRAHHLVGVLVRRQLGLAVHDTLQLGPGDGLVDGLEGDAEGSLRHAGDGVLGGAEDVALGEVDGDAVLEGVLGLGAEHAVLGEEEINHDLEIGGVVARVGEDEDGVELDLAEVAGSGGGALLVGEELLERRDLGVGGVDVVGDHDVLEAVQLGDLAALVLLASDDEDRIVVLGQGGHGGVGLDELLGGDGDAEDLGQLVAALALDLATAVGEEDVGDLDAELVVAVQDLQGAAALGDETVSVHEDSVNVKGECHVLCRGGLDGRHVLQLRGNDFPRWLDGGHARADVGRGHGILDVDARGQPRLSLGAGDGEGGAEAVAGSAAVSGGWGIA